MKRTISTILPTEYAIRAHRFDYADDDKGFFLTVDELGTRLSPAEEVAVLNKLATAGKISRNAVIFAINKQLEMVSDLDAEMFRRQRAESEYNRIVDADKGATDDL